MLMKNSNNRDDVMLLVQGVPELARKDASRPVVYQRSTPMAQERIQLDRPGRSSELCTPTSNLPRGNPSTVFDGVPVSAWYH